MPEGDSIFKLATRARPVLEGQRLTVGRVGRLLQDDLVGRRVDRVASQGKNLLLHLDDDRVIRVHLGIAGSAPVSSSARSVDGPVRLLLRTERGQLAVVNPLHCQVLSGGQAIQALAHLGPDLMAPTFDRDEPHRRAIGFRGSVSDLLLDQRVAAGIGNVYKCELLFVHRLHPERPASDVDDVRPLFDRARDWLLANRTTARRKTTGTGFPGDLYVYDRARRPCMRCRTPIRIDTVSDRPTYWCPRCQV